MRVIVYDGTREIVKRLKVLPANNGALNEHLAVPYKKAQASEIYASGPFVHSAY